MVTKHLQRKVVQIEFSVEGRLALVSAAKTQGGELIEKKEVANAGHAALTFPGDFVGSCYVSVQGTKPGSAPDTGTISVD